MLASAGSDRTVQIWETPFGTPAVTITHYDPASRDRELARP
jgi:hypothetical protein